MNANKFFVAIQAALAVASTSLAPFVTPLQIALIAVGNAFIGALVVHQVSNEPKP